MLSTKMFQGGRGPLVKHLPARVSSISVRKSEADRNQNCVDLSKFSMARARYGFCPSYANRSFGDCSFSPSPSTYDRGFASRIIIDIEQGIVVQEGRWGSRRPIADTDEDLGGLAHGCHDIFLEATHCRGIGRIGSEPVAQCSFSGGRPSAPELARNQSSSLPAFQTAPTALPPNNPLQPPSNRLRPWTSRMIKRRQAYRGRRRASNDRRDNGRTEDGFRVDAWNNQLAIEGAAPLLPHDRDTAMRPPARTLDDLGPQHSRSSDATGPNMTRSSRPIYSFRILAIGPPKRSPPTHRSQIPWAKADTVQKCSYVRSV